MKMKKLKKRQDSGVIALRAYYEQYVKFVVLKYNPIFMTGRMNKIIYNGEKSSKKNEEYLKQYDPLYQTEGILSRIDYDELYNKKDDYYFVLNRLQKIQSDRL